MIVELMVTAVVACGVGLGMGLCLWAYRRRVLGKPVPEDWMPRSEPLPRPLSHSMPPVAPLHAPKAEPPPAPPVKPKRRLQIHWPTPDAEAAEPPPSPYAPSLLRRRKTEAQTANPLADVCDNIDRRADGAAIKQTSNK